MSTENKTFTEQQLEDWQDYEQVRKSGRYNMYDARARAATGLSLEAYLFVLGNYTELRDAVEGTKTE